MLNKQSAEGLFDNIPRILNRLLKENIHINTFSVYSLLHPVSASFSVRKTNRPASSINLHNTHEHCICSNEIFNFYLFLRCAAAQYNIMSVVCPRFGFQIGIRTKNVFLIKAFGPLKCIQQNI